MRGSANRACLAVCIAWLSIHGAACSDDDASSVLDAGNGPADAGTDTGDAGGTATDAGREDAGVATCSDERVRAIRILAAPLDGDDAFEQVAELSGPGVASAVMLHAAGVPALFWLDGSLVLGGMTGFWDIALAGPADWHETNGLVHTAFPADLDGDGDQDTVLVNTSLDPGDADGGVVGPQQVSHQLPFERTDSGLIERPQIFEGSFVFMPASPADLDGDDTIDLLSYEDGRVIGHLNRGAFAFTREELGEKSEQYDSQHAGTIALLAADRDGDRAPDVLAVMGATFGSATFAMLNDGAGRFSPPEREVRDQPAQAGLVLGDVTGDDLADVALISVADLPPKVRLIASVDAATFADPVVIADDATGLRLADVDEDGQLDLLTSRHGELIGLVSSGDGFEERELGLALPDDILGFVADPALGAGPARVYVAQKLCER